MVLVFDCDEDFEWKVKKGDPVVVGQPLMGDKEKEPAGMEGVDTENVVREVPIMGQDSGVKVE